MRQATRDMTFDKPKARACGTGKQSRLLKTLHRNRQGLLSQGA
jgi:hypothetical protein